ncbi:MAG TPA: sulfite exporter TauE/SafE family protein [Thermoanaerobaculia bacterium]|nr:sulfite exporter TauE/SafE family protein [Thermoanaerobaculia bacterium]
MPEPSFGLLFAIGVFAGILSGLFGIGGGVVIVPALIYIAGFRQHMATGTSLAVLLPPIGIAAAFEYYRNGNVNFRAAWIIAVAVLIGGWLGAVIANRMAGPQLRLAFGIFVVGLGIYLIYGAMLRLGWLRT